MTTDTVEYVNFVTRECEMAEKMIKKNFSNFSAWHYRAQLMPKIYQHQQGLLYVLPIDRIIADLDMLKHAFFTDPNDQSPWNYHEWLISLVTPIQIVALKADVENNCFEIGLSQQVKDFGKLDISITDEQGQQIQFLVFSKGTRDLSSTWILKLEQPMTKLMLLYIKMRPSTCPSNLVSC